MQVHVQAGQLGEIPFQQFVCFGAGIAVVVNANT
jgi:hypothetical protein